MKLIQIIGGNSDIAFATAKKFANEKYNIHLVSRNLDNLKLKKDIIEKKYQVDCMITELDIENDQNVNSFIKNNKHNAQVLLIAAGYLGDLETEYEKIININYVSLIKYIEKILHQKNLKTIIGISSISGDRGKKKNSIYSSSKAAFSNYLDGLRQRLYKEGRHVITIKPGYVDTKMIKNLELPSILVSKPELIAKIILKSFIKNRSIVYAPGYWKYLMAIYRLIPEIIFKLFDKRRG